MEIYIFGEIVNFDGWEGTYNSRMIKDSLKEANGEDVFIYINSIGGDLYEGFAIYTELRRYASKYNAKITTIAQGQCASIATVIFLAGDERVVSEFVAPFVHNAWVYTEGNNKELMRTALLLEECDKKLAEHYSKHTDLTESEALVMMGNDTTLTPDECIDIRFATKKEELARPLAKFRKTLNNLKQDSKMKKKPKNLKGKKESVFARWGKLIGVLAKDIYTANNEIVVFPDLDDEESPKVGDMATIDGEPADGEHTMANGEVYVFEKGALIEIREVYEEPETLEEAVEVIEALEEDKEELIKEVAELKEEKEELEAVLARAESKIKAMSKGSADFKKEARTREGKDSKPSNRGKNAVEGMRNLKKQ